MVSLKKKVVVEEVEPDAETELNKNVTHVIKELSRRRIKDAHIEFFHAVREFFSSYFNIKYQFTFHELNTEIQKKRLSKMLKKRTDDLLKKVSAMEFGTGKQTEEQLLEHLKKFEFIASKLLAKKPRTPPAKSRFGSGKANTLKESVMDILSKLKFYESAEGKKTKEERKKLQREKKEEEINDLEKIHHHLDSIKSLYDSIIKALKNNKTEQAKADYLKLEKLYEDLDPTTRKQHYDMLQHVYKQIISQTKVEGSEIAEIDEIMQLLEETEKLIHEIDIKESKEKYHSILQRYQRLESKHQQDVYHRLQALWSLIKRKETDKVVKEIEENLEHAAAHLSKNNVKKASKYYLKSYRLYEELPGEHKEKIYQQLKNFYDSTDQLAPELAPSL